MEHIGNCSLSVETSDIPFPLKMTLVVIMSFVALIGILGNALIIAAVVLYDKLRIAHNIFIVNLAVADLMVNTIVTPFAITGAVKNGSFLCQHQTTCSFLGLLLVVSCGASVWSIASIAIERYVFICHNLKYRRIYNRRTFPIIVVCIWVYAFLLDLPNLVGWGHHVFSRELLTCAFLPERSYIWFLNVMGGGIPFPTLCYCYTRIYLYVRRSRVRLRKASESSNPSMKSGGGIKGVDKRLIKIFIAIVYFFASMWTPFMWTYLVYSYGVRVPHWVLYIFGNLCLANSAVNFWIYAFNKDFRDGYFFVVRKFIPEQDEEITLMPEQDEDSILKESRDNRASLNTDETNI